MLLRVAALLAFVTRAVGTTTTVTATSAVTTTRTSLRASSTTSRDLCVVATHPCVCASALSSCAWVSYANGGGRCFYDANANIDCGLCPSQVKCAGSPCATFSDACRCALSPSSCAWITGTNACVARGSMTTPCSACSSQPVCQLAKPQTIAFDPPRGSRGSGVDDVLQVVFDVELKWCVRDDVHSVSFWCEGSQTQSVGPFFLTIVSRALNVDISDAVQGLARDEDRVCGLFIHPELLCNRVTGAPYAGLSQGVYSFTLSDTSAPTVDRFHPNDGATQVNPDTVVQFTFNEPVVLGPSTLFLTLSTLDTESSEGGSTEVSSRLFAFEIPHVSAKGNTILQFDMKGKTNPGWLYSIALPRGAVADYSGNVFAGLSGGRYTFRVAPAVYGPDTGGGSDMTGLLVAIVVGLVCGGICVATLVWKFQNACYVNPAYRVKERRPGPVPVPAMKQVQPQVESVEPSTQATTPSNTSSSFHGPPSQNGPSGAQRSSPANEKLSWARTGSPAPKPERIYHDSKPERVYPEPRRSSSQGRPPPAPSDSRSTPADSRSGSKGEPRPKPAPKPEPTTKTVTSPVVEGTTPETRAIEKKMREVMNEPVAVRKKVLKDLMLEHHPDKNAGSDSAKEVFQFINAARGWFLHDA